MSELTLGPVLFHWPAELKRDFYFRIADEAPIDTVYLGEVVCSKRAPFFERHYTEVAARLRNGGKKVVYSSLAEVTSKVDRKLIESIACDQNVFLEANDVSALWHLNGRAHAIGPYLNVYNEDSLAFLQRQGCTHVTLPAELSESTLRVLAQHAAQIGLTLEVQVYGRIPLALSARCYHARARGWTKDSCQFVCEEDPDGMQLRTLEDRSFLTINGIQTMSHTCLNLVHELRVMAEFEISCFRLSPHTSDMVAVANVFRGVLDQAMDADEADAELARLWPDSASFSNGFYHHQEGHHWIRPGATASGH